MLLRPSEVARAWEMNVRTVLALVKSGRLSALRTPGSHYRLREADVRAYCELHGLPLPRALAARDRRVVLVGKPGATTRALARALEGEGVEVLSATTLLDGTASAASHRATALVVDARVDDVPLAAAARALRGAVQGRGVPVLVFGANRPRVKDVVAIAGKTPQEICARALRAIEDAIARGAASA